MAFRCASASTGAHSPAAKSATYSRVAPQRNLPSGTVLKGETPFIVNILLLPVRIAQAVQI